MKSVVALFCLLLVFPKVQSTFTIGTFNANTCNIQTTLDFQFSSSDTLSQTGVVSIGLCSQAHLPQNLIF
jgi:secreted trypsin-like serine protease